MSRNAVSRALAVAGVPRRRFNEFLAAYRSDGLEAVRLLDDGESVAKVLELEQRYRKAGVMLDPQSAQRERDEAARDRE